MTEKEEMLSILNGHPICPYCKRELDYIELKSLEYVYYITYLHENKLEYEEEERELSEKNINIYYCPYCLQTLPIHSDYDAREFLSHGILYKNKE